MPASPFAAVKKSLYLICDGETCARQGLTPGDFVSAAAEAGVGIIQYRHKNLTAQQYAVNLALLQSICKDTPTVLVVNDHAAAAEKFSLPLHLGQGDELPRDLTVPYGRSTHNFAELALALHAQPQPAYIALGTMFPSPTKPGIGPARDLVPAFLEKTNLPLVLIGGITLENAGVLPQSERIFYAVIGDAFRFGATRGNIAEYVRRWP